MKTKYLLIALVCLLLVGCGSSTVTTPPIGDGEAYVSIVVDWTGFEEVAISAQTDATPAVTSVGARMVYVQENAVFTQAVSRETAASQGVITLAVPTTDHARLKIAVVHESAVQRGDRVLYLGHIDHLGIAKDEILEVTMGDFDLIEPSWQVHEDYLTDFLAGGFAADKDRRFFSLPIEVRDPFQEGELLDWNRRIIRLDGSGNLGVSHGGWRPGNASVENLQQSQTHSVTSTFNIYLDGSMFNLPRGRYFYGNDGEFAVHWQ